MPERQRGVRLASYHNSQTMLEELKKREVEGRMINVGLAGAGAMGLGIAWQVGKTPGMRLSFVTDLNLETAKKAREIYGKDCQVGTDTLAMLHDKNVPIDVFVESTNSIGAAAEYCLAAIERRAHVVLMNAEVDLILGPLLRHEAEQQGVVVTSDAGDQHGVLARMMEEIEMWGFDIVQAGNIKGFLNRYATPTSLAHEAEIRKLSLDQCCAYTDGSKLNIEMAIIGNQYGLVPFIPGMEGPKCQTIEEAINLFDFDAYKNKGRIDYILGARPGGGVYVVGKCEDEFQKHYLWYYKLIAKHPYYLFYRPYHLCHLETTRAIALAALYGKAVLTQKEGMVNDVYAYAKIDLGPGMEIKHGIGNEAVYGMVETTEEARGKNQIPQGVLDSTEAPTRTKIRVAKERDEPIYWDDVELPDGPIQRLYERQKKLAK